jgi:hypothetical protein
MFLTTAAFLATTDLRLTVSALDGPDTNSSANTTDKNPGTFMDFSFGGGPSILMLGALR